MSHEKWIILGLGFTVTLILSLSAALTAALNWSLLATITTLFALSYPLIWLAWRGYRFWHQTIMQLTTYTQLLKVGEHNLYFKQQHQNNLLLALQQEISALANKHENKVNQDSTLENILSHILDAWPVPVCLFDQHMKLTFRNNAMNEQLQQPMLLGSCAFDLGFIKENNKISHPNFNEKWQYQSISYLQNEQQHWLFSALDVTQLLQQKQSTTQQNLVRVLGHELRNSLTPMASMADTLLCNKALDEQQTRLVLSRIQQRSNRLLGFISEYSQLMQLPVPNCRWFNIDEVIQEAKAMQHTQDCRINFRGITQCYGDKAQLSQVLINLFKNSIEACSDKPCEIKLNLFQIQQQQIIEVLDNGTGFANLANVLTPFYTTKANGSGIGLSLCAEIVHNHQGELKVENVSGYGAKITMSWPAV